VGYWLATSTGRVPEPAISKIFALLLIQMLRKLFISKMKHFSVDHATFQLFSATKNYFVNNYPLIPPCLYRSLPRGSTLTLKSSVNAPIRRNKSHSVCQIINMSLIIVLTFQCIPKFQEITHLKPIFHTFLKLQKTHLF